MNTLFILLFAIWNMFLFYNHYYGISVILFILPLLYFIKKYVISNNLLTNKRGLWLGFPILLLSLTYLLFNNEFFYYLNQVVICILMLLMFIFTIKPTYNLKRIINDIFNILFEPFRNFSLVISNLKKDIVDKLHISEDGIKNIGSFLIILPIIAIVLLLLTSADMEFDNLIDNILKIPKNIFKFFDFEYFIWRFFESVIFFLYFASTLIFLSRDYITKNSYISLNKNDISNRTIVILMIALNIIYFIFDIIQIKSLLFHFVSLNINYAEYAREGFFQLMFVSLINLVIIFRANRNNDRSKLVNILSIIMIIFTFVIIISSILRMNLYESMYGYTLLRLLVYITLFTEIILIIPLVIYVFNKDFNITKYSLIIIITVYTFINFINIDSVIARRNIKRYYDKKDIDLVYLENGYTDNVGDLIDFYYNVDDFEIKLLLRDYLENTVDTSYDFQGFNVSKYNAKKEILKLK